MKRIVYTVMLAMLFYAFLYVAIDKEESFPPKFSKVLVVFNNSNDTITLENVSSTKEFFTLEDGSKIVKNQLKWFKTYDNKKYEEKRKEKIKSLHEELNVVVGITMLIGVVFIIIFIYIKLMNH